MDNNTKIGIIISSSLSICLIIVVVVVFIFIKNKDNNTKTTKASAQPPASTPAQAAPATSSSAPATSLSSKPELPSNIDRVSGWSGNHENPGDKNQTPEDCRQKALNSNGIYVAWGHRNDQHPDPNYRNTCFLYTQGFAPYAGDPNDKVHTTGCLNESEKVKYGCKSEELAKQEVNALLLRPFGLAQQLLSNLPNASKK
jgi:hypothetical protein